MLIRHHLPDEELIQLFVTTQQPLYFDELYNRYYRTVYRKCRKLVNNSMDAQDFTHDIFIRVFQKLDGFEHRSSFSTWICRIASNYCISQLNLARRLQPIAIDEQVEEQLEHVPDESEESRVYEETMCRVEGGVERLRPMDQTVLRLKYEQGISIEEIARLYSIKPCAVKMRLMRSRQKVQQFYTRQLKRSL